MTCRTGRAPRVSVRLIAVLSMLVTGCRTTGMTFSKSDSLKMLAPSTASRVSLPLTVRWTAGAADAPPGSRFAAFLDRGTVSPGEAVTSVLTEECAKQPKTCNQSQLLAEAGVFLTTTPSLLLRTLPTKLTHGTTGQEIHTLTVVVVDGSGKRRGEEFIRTEFEYERKGL